MSARVPVGGLAVVLTLTGVTAAATVSRPVGALPADAAVARPVQGATLVCPAAPPQSADLVTRTIVATSRPGEGSAALRALGPTAPPPLRVDLSTAVHPVDLPPELPLVVTASGPASGGLVTTRSSRGVDGRDRGWSLDRCTAPRTDAWFVGLSTAQGQGAALHVVNAEDAPAEISVRALTLHGPVSSAAARGVRLAPGASFDLPVEQLAPFEPVLAVEVVAARGRVASSIREYRGLGAPKPGGVDAVPEAERAEPVVTVAGVPGVATGTLLDGSRVQHRLTVGVPGDTDATVRVEVLDADRRFVPVGLDAVPVAAGTVTSLDLTPALTGERATVRVSSAEGVPLVAGVLVVEQAHFGDVHETLHLGATPPLLGATVVADAQAAGADLDTFVTVTSPDTATAATFEVAGHVFGVALPAGRAVTFKTHVASATGGPLVVTPAPGSPPVYAAAVVEELGRNGPLLGGVAVSGGLADVALPPASPDPTVGLVDGRRPPTP